MICNSIFLVECFNITLILITGLDCYIFSKRIYFILEKQVDSQMQPPSWHPSLPLQILSVAYLLSSLLFIVFRYFGVKNVKNDENNKNVLSRDRL